MSGSLNDRADGHAQTAQRRELGGTRPRGHPGGRSTEGPRDVYADATLASVLGALLRQRGYVRTEHYRAFSQRVGLEPTAVSRMVHPPQGTRGAPIRTRGTLLKVAEGLRLDAAERKMLESVAGHDKHPCFLAETRPRLLTPPECGDRGPGSSGSSARRISMRRAVLLVTAPFDPSAKILRLTARDGRWARTALRSGVVFGWHDLVMRATTPEGVSVLDFSQTMYQHADLRTVETLPLRDDLPIYLDQRWSNEHLGETDYVWAMIFIEALGGSRDTEFPQIFYETAEDEQFWGGVHLLTAGIVVGQFDTAVEILAATPHILREYVRESQARALRLHGREAHTITYSTSRIKRRPLVAEF